MFDSDVRGLGLKFGRDMPADKEEGPRKAMPLGSSRESPKTSTSRPMAPLTPRLGFTSPSGSRLTPAVTETNKLDGGALSALTMSALPCLLLPSWS